MIGHYERYCVSYDKSEKIYEFGVTINLNDKYYDYDYCEGTSLIEEVCWDDETRMNSFKRIYEIKDTEPVFDIEEIAKFISRILSLKSFI